MVEVLDKAEWFGRVLDRGWIAHADAPDGHGVHECSPETCREIGRILRNHRQMVEALRGLLAPYDGWDDFQLERRADPATFRAVKAAKFALASLSPPVTP